MQGLESSQSPGAPLRAWASLRAGNVEAYRWLFALCTIVTIAPLWSADVFPFQDYAGNMSYAAILAADAGSLLGQTYEVGGLLLPNGLLFWTWALLGSAVGFITAGKVLLTLYALALPLSVDRLLVASGRDRRFALLAFPLVYNYPLMMGFAAYATAIPLALYAVTWAYRLLEALRSQSQSEGQGEGYTPLRCGVSVAALSGLTFLAHAQGYLSLGVMAIAFVLFVPRTWREFTVVCAAFGMSLLLFFPWFWDEFVNPTATTALGGSPLHPAFQDPVELFARWPEYTITRWERPYDGWVFLGMLAVFVGGLLDRRDGEDLGEGRACYGIEVITAALVATYLLVPEHTVIQAAIGSRLVVFAMLFGIGWLRMPRIRYAPAVLLIAMTVMAVLFGFNVRADMQRFERDEVGSRFLPMIDALPQASRLAVIVQNRKSSVVQVHAHEHMYGYHFALNGWTAYSGFHSFPGRHAGWRRGKEVPYPGRQVRSFLRSESVCRFDYLLTRTKRVPRWKNLEDRVTYVDHSAGYSLWKLETDRIPLCTKDAKDAPAQAKVASTRSSVARVKPSALASTLSPKVGRARGRTLDGEWKQQKPRLPARARKAPTTAPGGDDAAAPPANEDAGTEVPTVTPTRAPEAAPARGGAEKDDAKKRTGP